MAKFKMKSVDKNITQIGPASFRARLMHRGLAEGEVFNTLNEARSWRDGFKSRKALDIHEESIFTARRQKREAQSGLTVGDALDRYLKEITSAKKGARDEGYRIGKAKRTKLAQRPLVSVVRKDVTDFLDEIGSSENNRRKYVSLISHLYATAKNKWDYPVENPVTGMVLPSNGKARERRLLGKEYNLLHKALKGEAQLAFIVSIETAMRQGEMFALDWKYIDWDGCSGLLPDTKNGETRTTYFSKVAMSALAQLRQDENGNDKETGKVFSISESQLRKQWEAARKEIGSDELHWHDLRHEATSRLFAKGLNVFEVTSITGHKTLAELRKYAHMEAKTILRKMNATKIAA